MSGLKQGARNYVSFDVDPKSFNFVCFCLHFIIVPHLLFIVITVGGLVAQVMALILFHLPNSTGSLHSCTSYNILQNYLILLQASFPLPHLVVCNGIVTPATIFCRILPLQPPSNSDRISTTYIMQMSISIPLLDIILMTLPTTSCSSFLWQTTIGPFCCHQFRLHDNVSYILRDEVQKRWKRIRTISNWRRIPLPPPL